MLSNSNCITRINSPRRWNVEVVLISLMVFFVVTIECTGGGKIGDPGDISDGKSHLKTNPEWSRKKSKSSECRLGGNRFPLNSTWSPDLGPPFGVWKCVKCTCTPVQKKKRIVAKVICGNIKNDCPEAKCANPVLAPGSCCKRCPGEPGFRDDFVMEEPEIENVSGKDFAILLNGRTSLSPVTTHRLATGRVFLRRGTLHFSFVLGPDTPIPNVIQFLSEDGKILEELEAQPTPYEVNNGRVCGTWTRVPRQYRTLLMKEKLWVALVAPNEEDIISGRIVRYKGVDTEVFSSLLSPSNNRNQSLPGGGTAIISVSAASDSLHISLVFNGIFMATDTSNVSVFIELIPSRQLPPVTDSIIMPKVFSDINEAQIMTTLGETSLRLLARGKVSMRVWSAESPEIGLEGPVTSRATCNVFHSVITSVPEKSKGTAVSTYSYGAGWGILYLLNDGDFEYQMKLRGLLQPVEKVVLQMNSKKKLRDLEDITASYKGGWINGTFGKPTFRDLDSLLRGHLQVSITMVDGRSLKGTFETISVTEALRAFHPSLLMSTMTWMAANAWVAVDEDCVMHYDIYLAGEDPSGNYDPTWVLQLRENDTSWDPRLDLVNVTLEPTISGREVAAHTTLLSKVTLSRLHAGVTYLDLTVISSGKFNEVNVTLTGVLHDIRVSPFCLLYDEVKGSINNAKMPNTQVQVDAPCNGFVCLDEEIKPIISKKCIDDEKIVYEDGSTWKSPVNNCARCMCTLGRIKCQDEPCANPSCTNAILLPGQCCSSCPVVSGIMSERVCEMDSDLHIIGAFWHPFLAPNGFDRCVTCYCNVTEKGTPVVECSRLSCPPLKCLDSEANFKGDSCCPKCPSTTPAPRSFSFPPSVVKGMVNEGELEMSDEQKKEMILAEGGCLERKVFFLQNIPRANGDIWYPRLSPNGIPLCVACSCKDGQISCVSETCPETECKKGTKCYKKKDKFKNHSSKTKAHRKRKNRRKKKEWLE